MSSLPSPSTPASASPDHRLSRRALLRAAGGVAGGLALAPMLGTRHARAAGPTLAEPEVIRSEHGVLDVTLRAAPVTVEIDGRPREMLAYNGQVPGPTLVAHPGDLLRIRLVNDLDTPTNLHTHGLHVSGEGNADNIMVRVGPGEHFDYEIPLRADHHTGTNWYHPHFHGHAARQMFAGLAGALVIEGHGADRRATGIGRDRVLCLSAHQFDDDTGQIVDPFASLQSRQVRLVNGQRDPVIDIAPGETQRWRLVNTSVNNVVRLALDGHTMTHVATDGNPHAEAVEVDEVTLPSGGRADVLVTGGEPGDAVLRVLPFDIGFGVVVPEARLATVRSSGPAVSAGPLRLGSLLRPTVDLRDRKVDVHREVAMTMAGGFGIDGRPYDRHRVDQWVELGAVEEWTVHNETGLVHPFHIHVNPYQVTHVDGEPVDRPSLEDTTIIGNNGGSITFRSHFEHFLGTAIFHCHFVTHAELGMMAIAEVVEPARGDQRRHGRR